MDFYVVRSGDTLYSIAGRYGLSPGLVARYNGLREPYRLAEGQCLLILQPLETYTVQPGDTLLSVARRADVQVKELWRRNPNLSGQQTIYPGQVLVTRLERTGETPLELSGYVYPFADAGVLRGILPYATWMIPFTYGFTEAGQLIEPGSEAIEALARQYEVGRFLHLSTLTENGTFSAQRAEALFASPAAQAELREQIVQAVRQRGYAGVDVDFEFLGAENAQSYAAFLAFLRPAVNAAGAELLAALAPKTYAAQPGILYEGHDYAQISAAVDAVLLMTYEWGYTYGPPMAVAPVNAVRRVLDYAVSEIPPEKIFMGFPNYAYDWTLPYEAGQTRAMLIGNEAAPALAAQVGAEIRFDEVSQTPYFNYTDGLGAVHEVWFEDPRSCLAKFRLVQEYGFRGLGVWNFMRPFTAMFSLLNAEFALPL